MIDIVIVTQKDYIAPKETNDYINNVLLEDKILQEALEAEGLSTTRVAWDDQSFNWESTTYIIFRAIWDYFERFEEFEQWLNYVKGKTTLLNAAEIIYWNIDKHYLKDLKENGVHVAPTRFIAINEAITLKELFEETGWETAVLKPCISGAGMDTYKINVIEAEAFETTFQKLIKEKTMMLQPFLKSIQEKGEISLMVMDGQFTHAILKKAKAGEFRVQDDHGGTVHHYTPTQEEIVFAEKAVAACEHFPIYARVDIIEDNNQKLSIAELELVEPELWFRFNDNAASVLAKGIKKLF